MAKIIKNGKIYNATSASEVSFDNSGTDLNSANVQNAIIEVEGKIPTIPDHYDAEDIVYDNTTSGLSATNTQTAIDEVNNKVPVVPDHYDADDIVYDNTTSELVSTDVQGAIDELVGTINILRNLGLNYTLVNIQSAEYTESAL